MPQPLPPIAAVHCHVAPMAGSWLSESVIANPMSGYPEYWERRSSWFGEMTALAIEVVAADGTRGFGFAGGGKGRVAAAMVETHFRQLLTGQGSRSIAELVEMLTRASIPYGRGGAAQEAISGIELALWDLLGKSAGKPVYELLGGEARDRLRVYYTGYDPEALAAYGIRDMKIAVPYGPAHGQEGMRKNEEAVARARDVLGPDAFLALDLYMAWDVEYTLRMYERLERYRIAWLEEPVLPWDYAGYAEIRRRVNTKVTGGEHEYTLDGFQRLIGEGCVDIVQPDIYRAGGITALRQIREWAAAAGIQLVCHGIGTPTYHFLATGSEQVTPFAEYVDIYRGTTKEWILTGDPRPADGWMTLDARPGFGYTLRPGGAPVATIW